MLKTKNILIATMVIAVIGIGYYAIVVSQKDYSPFGIAKTETSKSIPIEEIFPVEPLAETKKLQEMGYEVASVGTWQDKIKWARYHVVIGEPLAEEEQVKILAERIIKDITTEDPKLEKIDLLLYHDKSIACEAEKADARIIWTPDEFSIVRIGKDNIQGDAGQKEGTAGQESKDIMERVLDFLYSLNPDMFTKIF